MKRILAFAMCLTLILTSMVIISASSDCSHEGGVATCCQKAICTICSEVYGGFNPNKHVGGTKIINKTATYTGDKQCNGCRVIVQYGEEITPADVKDGSVVISNAYGKKDDEVTVIVYLGENTALGNYTAVLVYDSTSLQLVGMNKGEFCASVNINNGKAIGFANNDITEGTLFTATFKILKYGDHEVGVEFITATDANITPVNINVTKGTIMDIDARVQEFINKVGEDGYKVTNNNYNDLLSDYDTLINVIDDFNASKPEHQYSIPKENQSSIDAFLNEVEIIKGFVNNITATEKEGRLLNEESIINTTANITDDSTVSMSFNILPNFAQEVFSSGFITSLSFDNALPKNTKFILKDSETNKLYGYKTSEELNTYILNDFKELESNISYTDIYDNGGINLSGVIDEFSFVLIVDFSATEGFKNNKTIVTTLNIYDRDEYFDQIKSEYATIYSKPLLEFNTTLRRSIEPSEITLSTDIINKKGEIQVSSGYTLNDIQNGYIDTFNTDKTISVFVQLVDANNKVISFPKGTLIKDVNGLESINESSETLTLKGGTAEQMNTAEYSFVLDFSDCTIFSAGNYKIMITTSRVSNENGSIGYIDDKIDLVSVQSNVSFVVDNIKQLAIKPELKSLNGNETKIIDVNQASLSLVYDLEYINSSTDYDGNNTTVNITLEAFNPSTGTYQNIGAISRFVSGTLTYDLTPGDGTLSSQTLTLKGNRFTRNTSYRLAFTMTNNDVQVIRYLYLVTSDKKAQ